MIELDNSAPRAQYYQIRAQKFKIWQWLNRIYVFDRHCAEKKEEKSWILNKTLIMFWLIPIDIFEPTIINLSQRLTNSSSYKKLKKGEISYSNMLLFISVIWLRNR